MSIELEMTDDGRIRVRVDREGERAVSDEIDPLTLIENICTTAELDSEVIGNELMIGMPIKELPEEETEETSAQEDDNV